ncbi:SCP2 sterol-binding domain-containing protein [Dactylosporangium sp. NPDC049140]|uniref:SCP2 sterol-binding domain-containing protein n=1 Tax=Dactylosporangium sp. NPDC049140 TaxID=3155647 RepID=UPI00340CBEDD
MSDLDALGDFNNIDPKQFAQLVKNAPDSQLADLMSSPQRKTILDTIFSRFPELFRADRAGSTNAIIHWNITGAPDGGTDSYELVIANGACTLSPSPDQDPKLSITVGPVDFLKVVAGVGNPMMMFMTGKLKAKGDLGLAANIANLFDIPKA